MHALPAAPAGPKHRQIIVGTALASAAALSLFMGMIVTWLRMRDQTRAAGSAWVPEDTAVPMVAANVMLLALVPLCVFAQWAFYAAKRQDRAHTGVALALVVVVALMFINAQAYIWSQMKLPANGGTYNSMFYALTGVLVAAAIVGVLFSAVAAFRYLGGRSTDSEVVAAHALYWYVLSAAYAVLWFVVYVTK
jgi:cytochrome c oxidase subunit 3